MYEIAPISFQDPNGDGKGTGSPLHLYRHLLALRNAHRSLVEGDYVPMRSRHDVVLFQRRTPDERLLIALNTVQQPRIIPWAGTGTVLL